MDVGRLVACEEGEEGSDLLGGARVAVADVVLHQREVDVVGQLEVVHQGRVDSAGCDGVDAHTRLHELHGERTGQIDHAALRGAVGHGVRLAHQPGVRRDIDQRTVAFEQVRHGCLGDEEGPFRLMLFIRSQSASLTSAM